MAVQFILGRSGTGKTSYCIKAIVNALLERADGQSLILLVPEQATYQSERAILTDKRIAGYNRLNVLSFDHLHFLLLGKNTTRPAITRIGQQMIIQRILRDNSSRLKVFGSSATLPGLGRQMAQTITELHQYAKTPEDIDRLLEELQKDERNNLALLKFSDIGLIFKEYLKSIEGKFTDPDVQLAQTCRAVAKAGFAKGAKLWVDGFAGFTTSELVILAELLKVVADAQIALCLDPSKIDLANPDSAKLDPVGLFSPTERTYAALVEIVKKCKLQLAEPIILEKPFKFSSCQQLAHIEHSVFELEPEKIPAKDNVRIISAPNARAEVQFVARQILQLVKEKDYRYRDIAIIASDIDHYQHYIKASFGDYRIPFFIDKQKPLNQHPVVQLICSALQAVTNGFSGSDVFTYLKTDLVPIERYDVDLLENYCLAFGVSASDWQSDKGWHFAGQDNDEFDEQRINQIRLKAIGPLLVLRDRLCAGGNPTETISAGEFTQIIFDFLDSLQVRQRIADWIEEAVDSADYTTVDEHRQFYDKLVNIFDELVDIFAGRTMSSQDYVAILNSAFSQLKLAFIPPTLDQVLVGSIERSRHPDLKAVFLIGATQKQFPAPVSFDSILTDNDRIAAEKVEFPLAATAGQKLEERQYLAYIAFTRPSQFLCITYPLADDRGSAVPRSQFIANLESLFENLNEESVADEQIPIEGLPQGGVPKVHSRIEVADLLCSQLGKDASGDLRLVTGDSLQASREQLGELLDDIASDEPRPSEGRDEQLAELGETVRSAINYDNRAQLDRDIVEELFGEQIRSSATRLSTFAACPYRYFARYILELEERREFKLRPLDIGNFYHRILDMLLKQLNRQKKFFTTIEKEQMLEILRGRILKLVQEDSFISNFARRSAHNRFIIDSAIEYLEDCVLAISQMVRAGSFEPALSEVSFGEVKGSIDSLGEYEIGLSSGQLLFLDGKIDRLDIAELDGEKIAIVFDYKRRDKSFSWAKFYYGLDMQLPIYMLAVRNASDSQYKIRDVAGAFYMPVEVSPRRADLDELPKKIESFDYKAKGIFNGKFAQQLDGETLLKDSKFYNFYITKDGEPYGNYDKRGVLMPDDFEKLLRFTEKKTVQLTEEILSGKIDVEPYRLNKESPCSYCKYKSLCRFDWQINDYDFLESLRKLAVLEKMGAVDG